MRPVFRLFLIAVLLFAPGSRAFAATDNSAATPSSAPAKYDAFVKGATVVNGLLGVIRKNERFT